MAVKASLSQYVLELTEGAGETLSLEVANITHASFSYIFQSISDTANEADYGTISTSGSFSGSFIGSVGSRSFPLSVTTVDDAQHEADEVFMVKVSLSGLTFASGSSSEVVRVTILNNDAPIGSASDDIFFGGRRAWNFDGRAGNDTVDYQGSSQAVTLNLGASYAGGGDASGDRLSDIENLLGSDFDDVLAGDDGANRLDGRAGNDRLIGHGGNDVLIGGLGADLFQLAFGDTDGDVIMDFSKAEGDNIAIDAGHNAVLTSLGDYMFSIERDSLQESFIAIGASLEDISMI